MANDAKTEILAAIGNTNDANMRTVLLLILVVLDEIGAKIDALRSDEQGLREAVLNGHSAVHDAHHEWLAKRIAAGNCESTCAWVAKKIQGEAEDAKSSRKIRDGIIERGLWAVLVLSAATFGWWIK